MKSHPNRAFLLASRARWLWRERFRRRRYLRHKAAGETELAAKWHRLWIEAHKQRMHRDDQLRHTKILVVSARGVDVSNNQGAVNFDAIKAAGYSFAYLKATEGEAFIDPFFRRNVDRARQAKLKVGAYHFLRPRHGRTGAAEADDFARQLKAAGLGKGDLTPVCDVEVTELAPLATEAYVEQFLDAVEKLAGVRPLIYTYPFFIHPWASHHGTGLWIADYRGRKAPEIPGPWPRWVIWQHSSTAHVPGVSGNCDVNFCPDMRRIVDRSGA